MYKPVYVPLHLHTALTKLKSKGEIHSIAGFVRKAIEMELGIIPQAPAHDNKGITIVIVNGGC